MQWIKASQFLISLRMNIYLKQLAEYLKILKSLVESTWGLRWRKIKKEILAWIK